MPFDYTDNFTFRVFAGKNLDPGQIGYFVFFIWNFNSKCAHQIDLFIIRGFPKSRIQSVSRSETTPDPVL